MKMRIFWMLSLALALVLIATTVLPVKADPPLRFTEELEWTEGDTELCDFTITKHGYGIIRNKGWFDEQGNLIKADVMYGSYRVDWYSTGEKVLKAHVQGPILYNFLSDSELLIKMGGTDLFVIVPGHGPVYGQTGMSSVVFDLSDGSVREVKSSADHIYDEQDRQALCDYLRP